MPGSGSNTNEWVWEPEDIFPFPGETRPRVALGVGAAARVSPAPPESAVISAQMLRSRWQHTSRLLRFSEVTF